MVEEIWIEREPGKSILNVDLTGSLINSSLSNPDCCKIVFNALSENEIDEIVIIKSFRTIYGEQYTKLILEYVKAVSNKDAYSDPIAHYLKTKEGMNTELIKLARKYLKRGITTKEVYHNIFKPEIVPPFILSKIVWNTPKNSKLLESYKVGRNTVRIYEIKKDQKLIYFIKPEEMYLSVQEINELTEAFERITKLDFDEEDIDTFTAKNRVKRINKEILEDMKVKNIKKKSEILSRHSSGYGILELLFSDDKLQDIYVDSPSDKPIYVNHSEYGECETNIILSNKDIDRVSTKLRSISGRPFDQANPVLHGDILEYNIRVCGIMEPLTFSGTGYAFRKHKTQPWTLTEFLKEKMVSSETAGLLNFMVDGEASILVTGPRSSGKTSLLSALIGEVESKTRIIMMEDTPELPVDAFRSGGFNIQHLKISTDKDSYEVNAKRALRTALRLGESVLIIGEVRGEEAQALFEAMRVGAAGNAVMGTIHGSGAYDTWDRIVNDLGVPSTSFKATDIVVSCAPIRNFEDSKRQRRVVGITEVTKTWSRDPYHEKGFLDLAVYNRKKDKLELIEKNLKKSDLIKRIARIKGITVNQAIISIKTRGEVKKLLLSKNKLSLKENVKYNNKFLDILRKERSYTRALSSLKKYVK